MKTNIDYIAKYSSTGGVDLRGPAHRQPCTLTPAITLVAVSTHTSRRRTNVIASALIKNTQETKQIDSKGWLKKGDGSTKRYSIRTMGSVYIYE